MKGNSLKLGALLYLGIFACVFFTLSCGIQTPSLGDRRTQGATFSHEAFKDSCSSCHETHRPAPVNGAPHGSGMDCVKCHTYTGGWKGGVTGFSHNPMPKSCTSCHENKRPAPVNSYPHGNNLDCVSCHTPGNWKTGISYLHSADLTSCNSCHAAYRPSLGARNINYNNSAPFHKPGLYDGSHYSGKDCASCHRIPQTGATSWNFNHLNYQSQNVGFCLSCHFSNGWNKHSGNNSYFLDYGTCFNCHNVKVKSWDHN